jgi:hypothetical protein
MINLGDFAAGATVHLPWDTSSSDGSSITRATDGTIRVYKDNSVAQRASSAGITDSEDFDGLVGVHWLTIDLADNTDAGFYATGHNYSVVLVGAVVDGRTVNAVLGVFSIQNRYSSGGGGSAPSANDVADAVLTRATSNYEAVVKANPLCLGAAVMAATHKTRDNAGTLEVADSTGNYAGTNALSRAITTDASNAPIDELGTLS